MRQEGHVVAGNVVEEGVDKDIERTGVALKDPPVVVERDAHVARVPPHVDHLRQ